MGTKTNRTDVTSVLNESGRGDLLYTCFLLTGKPRVGKSTAITRIINRIGLEKFGGFYTEEVRDSTNRIGFNCVSLNGESQRIASVDSDSVIRVGRYGVEVTTFENIALKAIRESLDTNKITVIDEIGFMQMLSNPFQRNHEMISNQHYILGTICVDSHPEIDAIKELPGIKIYLLNEENREEVTEQIALDICQIDRLP
jgi:nucleoside-triphosphatase